MDIKKILLGLRESNLNTARALIVGLKRIEEAVKNKPTPTQFKIENTKEINKEIVDTLRGVIDTFKTEIGKLDREVKIKVKNDLPNLYRLFKKDRDTKDLLRVLSKIEKRIPTIKEGKDYSHSLEKIFTLLSSVLEAVSSLQLGVDLTPLEDLLKKLIKKNNVKDLKINSEDAWDKNALRISLQKDQLVQLLNISPSVQGLSNKLDAIKLNTDNSQIYPTGTGSNGSVTLTNADTAYAVPSTASTKKHILVLYNGSDTDIYWGFEDSNTNGILLAPDGRVTLNLGADEQIYAYCGTAGKVITYTYKEIE